MLSIIATLCRWLDHPEQRRLRREFALWVQRVLLRRKPFAERSILQGEEIQDLEEVQQMLAGRSPSFGRWPAVSSWCPPPAVLPSP